MADYKRRSPILSMDADPAPGMDSAYGGPNSWGETSQAYSGMGSAITSSAEMAIRPSATRTEARPGGERPYGGVGKYDAAQMLPLHPRGEVTPGLGDEPPVVLGPKTPGLFQSGLGGLSMLTELVPILNEHDGGLHDLFNWIGGSLDSVIAAATSGPYEGAVRSEYAKMERTSEKMQYDAFIAKDPANALRYMSQYMNQHAQEIAARQGINQLLSGMTVPSLDLSEHLSRLVFGTLMLPGSAINRMAMSALGHADAILATDPEDLEEGLRERVAQVDMDSYESRSQFADWLSQSPWRWQRRTGYGEDVVSFMLDVLLDPTTYATIGIGKAANIAGNAAKTAHAGTLLRLTNDGAFTKYFDWASKDAKVLEGKARGESPWRYEHVKRFHEENPGVKYEGSEASMHGRNITDIADEALSREGRYAIKADANIDAIKKRANDILGLYGMFGTMPLMGKAARGGLRAAQTLKDATGKALNKQFSDNFTNGWISWFGVDTVKSIQDFAGPANVALINQALTAAIVNAEASHIQRGIVSNVRAFDPDWRGANRSVSDFVREQLSIPGKLAADGEEAAARTAEHWLGSSGLGPDYVAEGRANFISSLTEEFAEMTGRSVDESRAFLEGMNDKGLALVHNVVYGNTVDKFHAARDRVVADMPKERLRLDALIKKLTEDLEEGQRIADGWQTQVRKLRSNTYLKGTGVVAQKSKTKMRTDIASAEGIETGVLAKTLAKNERLQKRLEKAQEDMARVSIDHEKNVRRYTLVSENMLTDARWAGLKAALDSEAWDPSDKASMERLSVIVDSAIDQYDVLRFNFSGASMSPLERRDWVIDFVTKLEASEGGLLKTVSPNSAPDIASALGRRYELGIAPDMDKRWGFVTATDGSGRIEGANTFMDSIPSYQTPARVDATFNRAQVFTSKWFSGIRGQRIYFEARQKFMVEAVKSYGIHRTDAARLFDALRAESFRRGVGTRALRTSDILDIAKTVGVEMEPRHAAAIGVNGLLELLIRSWEGDLMTVGAAPKLSGRIKRIGVKRTDNLIGRMSEDLYVKTRFALSPMFLLMETTEGPFFALLRGIKPGWNWSADDVRANSVMAFLFGKEIAAEQLDRAQRWALNGQVSVRVAGPANKWTAGFNRVLRRPENGRRFASTRVLGLHEWKELLYVRQWLKYSADEWVESMNKYAPLEFEKWAEVAGSRDPRKMFLAYMEDRKLYDPNARHGLHLLDASKPASVGMRERIRIGDVAAFHNFATVEALRSAVHSGDLSREGFVKRYTDLGLSEAYAERAYKVVSGRSEKQWLEHFESTVPDAAARDALIRGLRWHARRARMDFDEYLNEGRVEFYDPIQSAKDLPANADLLKQSVEGTIVASLGRNAYHPSTSPVFKRVQATMVSLLGDFSTDKKGLDKGAKHLSARNKVVTGESPRGKAWVPPPNGILAETKHHAKGPDRIAPGSPEDLKHLMESGYFDRILGRMESGFGGNTTALLSAANWYAEVPTMFIAIALTMNPAIVDMIWREWSKRNPKGAAAAIGDAVGDEAIDAAKREQIAARMCLGFLATQQNTSVADGMRMLARWQFALLNEWKAVEGLAEKGQLDGIKFRMNALLKDMGVMPHHGTGPKLSDFMDSGVGRMRRTMTLPYGDEDLLQPAAMDVWMYRILGYPDGTYIARLTMDRLKRELDEDVRNGLDTNSPEYLKRMAVISDNSPDGTYMMFNWSDPKKPKGGWPGGVKPPRGKRQTSPEMKKTMEMYGWYDETRDIPDSHPAPTEAEYEFMLMRTTQWAEYLNNIDGNGTVYLGAERAALDMEAKWTAREIQALLWVGEQKYLRYPGTDPVSAFVHSSAEFAIEPSAPAAHGVWDGAKSYGLGGPWAVLRPRDMETIRKAEALEAEARASSATARKGRERMRDKMAEAKALRASVPLIQRYPQHLDMVAHFSDEKNIPVGIADAVPMYIREMIADPATRAEGERLRAEFVSIEVTKEIGSAAMDAIIDDTVASTGVVLIKRQAGLGVWDQGGDLSSRTAVPNQTFMLWGTPEQRRGAALIVGAALRQDVVYGISRPGDTALRPSSNRPIIFNEALRKDTEPTKWQVTASFPTDAEVADFVRATGISTEGLNHLLAKFLEMDILERVGDAPDQFKRAEYPGSMARTLDTGHTAVAFTWDNSYSTRMQSMANVVVEMQKEVALKDIEGEAKAREAMFGTRDLGPAKVPKLDDDGNPVFKDGKQVMVPRPKTAGEKQLARADAMGKDLISRVSEEWAGRVAQFPAEMRKKYEDGVWIREVLPDAPLLPIKFGHELIVEEYVRVAENAVERRNVVGDEGASVQQHIVRISETATRAMDEAFERVAPRLFAEHRTRVTTSHLGGDGGDQPPFVYGGHRPARGADGGAGDGDLPGGALAQRNESNKHVRAAYVPGTDGSGSIYTIRGKYDASSIVHELFHHHLTTLDESMLRRMNDVYMQATGDGTSRMVSGQRLPKVAEEWWAAQFERFAANPEQWGSTNPTYYYTFKNFAEWAKDEPRLQGGVQAPIADMLDKVLDPLRDVPPVHFEPDSNRMWAATRTALMKAEAQAHKTVYYSKSRSLFERSLNHPYLGLYPASYMWGKVLPELIRFMVKEPFGFKAPMLGASMVGHVWRNMQYRLATDEDLNEWVDEHPELVNMLTLMVPGTPFEMPVNMPLYVRRSAEEYNTAKYEERPAKIDYMSWLGDMIGYAQGPVQTFNRLSSIAEEFNKDAPKSGEFDYTKYFEENN